ncbi:hypothetical protein AAG906_026644 [Vitis piasezkii]
MSSSLLLMEPMGGSFGRFLDRLFRSGRGARVVATGGLDLPGSLESELSSRGARGIGVRGSWGLRCCSGTPDSGYIDSARLEFATWPLERRRGGPDVEAECVTQRFLLLTSLSPGGELLVVFRLPTVSFRWLYAIQNYLLLLHRRIGFGKVRRQCCRLAYPVVHVAAGWIDTRFSTHKRVLDSAVAPAKGIRTGCPDAPSDGFVSHGMRRLPMDRSPFLLRVTRCGSWLFVVIACKTRFTLIDDPGDYIRMEHADYPDVSLYQRLLFLG